MDEQQNIYSLDFKFITNMGEHQIENDDGDAMWAAPYFMRIGWEYTKF